MMVIKRRHVVIVSLIVMIVVAGYLNWSYKNNMELLPTTGDSDIQEKSDNKVGEIKLVLNDEEDQSSIEDDGDKTVVNTANNNLYFTEARMEKERSRSESLEILQGIVNDQNSSKEIKDNAQNEMIGLTKNIDKEVTIENIIKSKDFKNVVVFINEDNVNVIVQSEGLTPSQVAQIQEIVITQTSAKLENIKLREVK